VKSLVNPFRLKLSESLASPRLFTLSLEGCVIFFPFLLSQLRDIIDESKHRFHSEWGEINE
jgi:hypothetical protein